MNIVDRDGGSLNQNHNNGTKKQKAKNRTSEHGNSYKCYKYDILYCIVYKHLYSDSHYMSQTVALFTHAWC